MNFIKQTIAVTMLNLRTIPQRLGSSGVAIVGIAGVVIVLVSVLSIAQGFSAAMEQSGSDNRALVMRSGADSEMTSGLGGPEVDIIKQAPGLRREGQTGVASAELYVIIDIPKIGTNSPANVPMRGVEPQATMVRDEFSLVEGRMFQFGTNEVVVGRGAMVNFQGLTLGSTIHSGQNTWQVVGIFETDGSIAETEIWCDSRVLQGAYRRGNSYQTVLARLDSSQSFDTFRDWLIANPQVNLQVRRETEYYAQQSRQLSTLIRTIGFGIAALMGIGAVFGAILTMYTAVSTRSREIATLRALGFNTTSGTGVGIERITGPRRNWRRHRRRARIPRLQRLPDVDDELLDVQPGGIRIPGHTPVTCNGSDLCLDHGIDRRALPCRSCCALAYPLSAQRVIVNCRMRARILQSITS